MKAAFGGLGEEVISSAAERNPTSIMRQLRATPSGRLDAFDLLADPPLRHMLDVLNVEGEETRLVGGAVRNALLGLPPGDLDLATTMPPTEVMRHAKAARLRAIPTGLAHGTITILDRGHSFEVTTLRQDVETDGRHAVVRFGRDFALDAQRRDFTMNALSVGTDGRLFDTVGGLDDLAHGQVRFIGDAQTRIREDYLRILRFFRFHAIYGIGLLDTEGLSAATLNRNGLARLSRERVRAEMFKILAAPGAMTALQAMREAGILGFVLPGSIHLDRLNRLIVSSPDADATLRLAALAVDDAAGIDALRDALRLTNAEVKRLDAGQKALADLATLTDLPDEAALRRLLFDHGRDAARDALRLRHAVQAEAEASLTETLAILEDVSIPPFPFASADLMRRGLRGPALGAALTGLRRRWAEAGFPADQAALDRLLGAELATQAVS